MDYWSSLAYLFELIFCALTITEAIVYSMDKKIQTAIKLAIGSMIAVTIVVSTFAVYNAIL